MIIIHSYFPPSLLSKRYAKLAGDLGLGNVGASNSISSLNVPFVLTVVRWLKDSVVSILLSQELGLRYETQTVLDRSRGRLTTLNNKH